MLSDKRLKVFTTDIEKYKKLLLQTKHLAITGVTGVGSRNIVRLLNQELIKTFETTIYDDGFITIQNIRDTISNNSRKTLICIPNFSQKDNQFKLDFQTLLLGANRDTHTIISIDLSDYMNYLSAFKISKKPISIIQIQKPRNKEETFNLIQEYCTLEIAKRVIDQIFDLSGGIASLMKASINFYQINTNLDEEKLMKAPNISITLNTLFKEFTSLSQNEQIEFGLTNNKGEVISTLLGEFISLNSNNRESLVDKLHKLLLKNKDQVLSIDMVDEFIAENGEFSLWNRYKLIERVRAILSSEHKLTTIRNKGYKLTNVSKT